MSNYNFEINTIENSVLCCLMFLYTLIFYILIKSIITKMFAYNHVMLLKINKCIELVYKKMRMRKMLNYLIYLIIIISIAISSLKKITCNFVHYSFFFNGVYYYLPGGWFYFIKPFVVQCSIFYILIILIIIKMLSYNLLIVKNKIAKLGDVIIICVNSINIKKCVKY